MSVWNYIMPHRLLLNKSLRKVSQELLDRVDAYQVEYDRRVEECKAELVDAETEKNRLVEEFREAFIQELKEEGTILDEIQTDIVQYTDCFFQRAYLYQLRSIRQKQNNILHEEYSFLAEQIKYVDAEINLLRERQGELTAFTAVDDIINLEKQCGYDLGFNTADNAKSLLTKISDALKSYQGDDSAEKFALLRLKAIIQERSDYLPTINYISWVIQIKKQFSKKLSIRKSDIKNQQATIRKDVTDIKNEILSLTDQLVLLSIKVRYHWARPITYINADICYAYVELSEDKIRLQNEAPRLRDEIREKKQKKSVVISEIQDKKGKRRDVGSKIRSMKDSHSSDQWRWDSLKRESRDLTSDIDSLSSDIDHLSSDINSLSSELDSLQSAVKSSETMISSKKNERKEWAARRARLVDLIKKYDKSFRSDSKIAESDEINIIEARVSEIQVIREDGKLEAQRVFKQERKALIAEHEQIIKVLDSQENELQKKLATAEAEYQHNSKMVSQASRNLKKCAEEDNRFVLFKALSEAPSVTVAKRELEKVKASLSKQLKKKIRLVLRSVFCKRRQKRKTPTFKND